MCIRDRLKRAVEIAPRGAKDLMQRRKMFEEVMQQKAKHEPLSAQTEKRSLNVKDSMKVA